MKRYDTVLFETILLPVPVPLNSIKLYNLFTYFLCFVYRE